MKPAERDAWLLSRTELRRGIDVLDRHFVDAYVEATGAKFEAVAWGANRCPQLGRDLARLYGARKLTRGRIGLGGNWQPGFPKWVWSYQVRSDAFARWATGDE